MYGTTWGGLYQRVQVHFEPRNLGLTLKLTQKHCINRFNTNIRVQLNQYVTPTFWGQSRLDPVIFGLSFIFILDTHMFKIYIIATMYEHPFRLELVFRYRTNQLDQELFIQYFWVRICLTQVN